MKLKFSLLEIRNFSLLGLLALIVCATASVAQAQAAREPRKEQILNGLKVFLVSDPKSEKLTIKLRINAGAAFDPAGKSGTMRLLGDLFFPDEGTKQFFEEDLNGSLAVAANYDFIQITATGDNDEFERILDAVRTAVIAPPFSPENFKKVRDARLRQAQEAGKNTANVADSWIRKRLYGDFPYGRIADGTPESLARIEYGDLIAARDRFLNADNSALVIIGNVKENYALRAVRQLFGSWRKADKPLLTSFRQPDAPDARILIVDSDNAEAAEIRLAVRAPAHGDKDFPAAEIFGKLLERKLQNEFGAAAKVETNPHVLPGEMIVRVSSATDRAAETLNAARAAISKVVTEKIDSKAFAEAQSELSNAISAMLAKPETAAELWLDAETFKAARAGERLTRVKSVTAADAERVAARLFKDAPQAIVIVGDAEKIQPQIDAAGAKK